MYPNQAPNSSASAHSASSSPAESEARKPYTAPSLTNLGTVADRTADLCWDFAKGMPVPCS
jgi:hypothetical protein